MGSVQRAVEQAAEGNPGRRVEAAVDGRSVSRGTLAGAFDTANIGSFTFHLYRSAHNVQLGVGQLGSAGNVGGQFSLVEVPSARWTRLIDRANRPLPVWILLEESRVEVTVGSGPPNAPILRPVDRAVSGRG